MPWWEDENIRVTAILETKFSSFRTYMEIIWASDPVDHTICNGNPVTQNAIHLGKTDMFIRILAGS